MEVYVARQPIFNKQKKIYGYELLFRGGMTNAFPDIDGDLATSKLLSSSFFSIGMEKLTGGKIAFINFTQELLLKNMPSMFPHEKIMVEVLEDVDPTEQVINACQDIAGAGYEIALDDFVFRDDLQPLIELATIIKIDFRLTPMEEIEQMVGKFKALKIKLLAEKIETYDEFEASLDMGFVYFQGYFFSKPEILSGTEIVPSKINLLQIIGEVNKEDCELGELENLINRDVSLSYKLLRYINSAYYRRVQEISSIKHAIVLLGMKEIKQFISLVATAELASDKPDELVLASFIRAKFCELLGKSSRTGISDSELFLMGLFSLIDAMLDNNMENVMKSLPLSGNIKMALLEGKGTLADYLELILSYETAEWEKTMDIVARLKLDENSLQEYYLEAVSWADAFPKA